MKKVSLLVRLADKTILNNDSSMQGHSRRLHVCVKPVQNSGTLPLLVEALLSISIGCVSARSTKLQRPLDSYQVCRIHARHLDFMFWEAGSQSKRGPCWAVLVPCLF